MPKFEKGHKKLGGRTKGTLNKVTQDILDRAAEMGVDPFQILLYYCARNWKALGYSSETITKVLKDGGTIEVERIPPERQLEAVKEACQYMYPKRKAIELSNKEGSEGFKIIFEDYGKKDTKA
jgi:hypothetical protein